MVTFFESFVFLRANGIFIPRNKSLHIYTALYQAVNEHLDWSEESTNRVENWVNWGYFDL